MTDSLAQRLATDEEELQLRIPRREAKEGSVWQLQRVPGTATWALVEKGDLEELVRKARAYDVSAQVSRTRVRGYP
jgi:hypothetical protein